MPTDLNTFDDLESYWKDLRPHIKVRSEESESIEKQLHEVAGKTLERVKKAASERAQHILTPEQVAETVVIGIRIFMQEWYEQQRKHDIGNLIEIILESQKDLPISDMKGFIQALPRPIIARILNELKGQARGLHALLACEIKRRDREISNYELSRDPQGNLVVSFTPNDERNPHWDQLSFTLREIFTGG